MIPLVSFIAVLAYTVWLWKENMVNPMIVGTAEGLQTDITCPVDGRVKVIVDQYKEVNAGDVVAVVDSVHPEVLTNTVAMIRAEMEKIRAEAGFDSGDKVRFAQYQMDWMNARVDLASLKVRVQWAEEEYNRVAELVQQKVDDQQKLDTAKRDLEDARAQVAAKQALVDQTGQTLKLLDPASFVPDTPAVKAAVEVAQQQLKLAEAQLQPVTLTAPISGRVSKVSKLAGSIVSSAEVIATIADPKVDRIIGYVSQPIRLEPKPDMPVKIRTRGASPETVEARITHVGPRIELFTAPLRIRGMGAAMQRGLPFVVTPPPGLKLLPGELVDITILAPPGS